MKRNIWTLKFLVSDRYCRQKGDWELRQRGGGGVADQLQHHQQGGRWGERGERGHDHSAIVEFSEEWKEGGTRKWDLLAELEASHTADTGDKRLKGGWYRYMCL